MKQKNTWTLIGFLLGLYAVFVLVIVIGYPLAQQFARPIAAVIFPINEHNSLMRTLMVMSLMYWGMTGAFLFLNRPKDSP